MFFYKLIQQGLTVQYWRKTYAEAHVDHIVNELDTVSWISHLAYWSFIWKFKNKN